MNWFELGFQRWIHVGINRNDVSLAFSSLKGGNHPGAYPDLRVEFMRDQIGKTLMGAYWEGYINGASVLNHCAKLGDKFVQYKN